MLTCSDEHVRDVLVLNIAVHLEAEEIHHAGEVVLVGQPRHHLDVEVRPGEVPGVDVADHLLESRWVHLFNVDLLASTLHHVGLNCGSENGRADTEETLVNWEDRFRLLTVQDKVDFPFFAIHPLTTSTLLSWILRNK